MYKIFDFKTLPLNEDSDNEEDQIDWVHENLQNNNAKKFYTEVISKKFNDSPLINLLKKLKIENEITLITENPKFVKFQKNIAEFQKLFIQQMDIFIAVLKYFIKFENQKLKFTEKHNKKETNEFIVSLNLKNGITHKIIIKKKYVGCNLQKAKKLLLISFLEYYFEDAFKYIKVANLIHKEKKWIQKKFIDMDQEKNISKKDFWFYFSDYFKARIEKFEILKKDHKFLEKIPDYFINKNFYYFEIFKFWNEDLKKQNLFFDINLNFDNFLNVTLDIFEKDKNKKISKLKICCQIETVNFQGGISIALIKLFEFISGKSFKYYFQRFYMDHKDLIR